MSTIHKALIQKNPKTGEFIDANTYAAWSGFTQMGVWCESFTWPQMQAGEVELTRDTVVVGGIPVVRGAVEKLGFPPPVNQDYPDALIPWLGRSIQVRTLREVRASCVDDRIDPPVFIKPLHGHKAFTGHVVSCYRDIIKTAHLPPDMKVWVSDVVEFTSECRYFVNRGNVVGVGHYFGDPLKLPEGAIVGNAVRAFEDTGTAPVSYTLDFGVVETHPTEGTQVGRRDTYLVESNDGFAVGCYGLNAVMYAKFIEDRWTEMVGLPLSFRS